MGDPSPQNLGFEAPGGGAGLAQGWLLVETPQAREHALFGALTLAGSPAPDPAFGLWTDVGGHHVYEDSPPPYNPANTGFGPDPAVFAEDASAGLHGMVSPDALDLQPGGSYTVGLYVSPAPSGTPRLVGVGVQLTAQGGVGAVVDPATGRLAFCGPSGSPSFDPAVVLAVSAEVAHYGARGGPSWTRVAVTFTLAANAVALGLTAATVSVLLYQSVAEGPSYTGNNLGAGRAWGLVVHRGDLSPEEGFEGAWGANEGYLRGLSAPATATLALYPSASPGGAPYDDFERWQVPYHLSLDGIAASTAWGLVYDQIDGGWTAPAVGLTGAVTVQNLGGPISSWYADGLAVVFYDADPAAPALTGTTAGFIDDSNLTVLRDGGSAAPGDNLTSNVIVYQQADASVEGFEEGWANGGYAETLTSPTAASWVGALPAEGFESGWGLPASGTTSSAVFSADLDDAAETFERTYDDAEYSVAASVLYSAGHPFTDGVRVQPVNVGGSFPFPLLGTLRYYVVSTVPGVSFQVSDTDGGAPLAFGLDGGQGTQIMRADRARYWPGPDINPTL